MNAQVDRTRAGFGSRTTAPPRLLRTSFTSATERRVWTNGRTSNRCPSRPLRTPLPNSMRTALPNGGSSALTPTGEMLLQLAMEFTARLWRGSLDRLPTGLPLPFAPLHTSCRGQEFARTRVPQIPGRRRTGLPHAWHALHPAAPGRVTKRAFTSHSATDSCATPHAAESRNIRVLHNLPGLFFEKKTIPIPIVCGEMLLLHVYMPPFPSALSGGVLHKFLSDGTAWPSDKVPGKGPSPFCCALPLATPSYLLALQKRTSRGVQQIPCPVPPKPLPLLHHLVCV